MNRFMAALGGLVALVATGPGYSQQGEADPNQALYVTPTAGPWMILVTSFRGDLAPQLAHGLVTELRSRYKLPAYIFVHGREERLKQEQELERQRQEQRQRNQILGIPDTPIHVRKVRIEEQYAILVGGYKDMDAAHKALEKIKKLPPPSQQFMDAIITVPEQAPSPGIPAGRLQSRDQSAGIRHGFMNPFLTSFVVPNPTVPVARHENKPDLFLKELNADETYSLLTCPKPWTLVIKEFQGATVTEAHSAPTKLLDKLLGRNSADYLDASAKQAHELARIMREAMHLEAYVLHTRYASLLTVGSFDSLDDPRLLQMQRQLANLHFVGKGDQKSDPNMQMFARPLPMKVPRP